MKQGGSMRLKHSEHIVDVLLGKAVPLVLLEALLIAFFWVFIGAQLPKLLNRRADRR